MKGKMQNEEEENKNEVVEYFSFPSKKKKVEYFQNGALDHYKLEFSMLINWYFQFQKEKKNSKRLKR